jgi:neutral ceramidase
MITARSFAYLIVNLALFCAPLVAFGEVDSSLHAGTAKVDISPAADSGMDLLGRRLTPHDPLYARVVVLKSQDTSVAIVSVDLIIFASKRVIDECKAKWKLDHVVLCATHTHAGMAARGMVIAPPASPDWTRSGKAPADTIDWPGLSADPWYAQTEDKIVAAVGTAMQQLFPARVVVGKGPFDSAYMAHNRRLVTDKGVTMLWENPNRIPTQPLDPTVGVIRIEDLSGKPRALAVHYACHPVALMNTGLMSRDFPGAMVDHIEQELGPDCMAMFLQGALGDIDPYDLSSLRGRNRLNIVQQAGISLAKRALSISSELKAQSDNAVNTIQVKESLLSIPNRTGKAMTDVGLITVVVNRELALFGIPGEPFIQHQLDLAALSPLANSFVLSLAYHGKGTPYVVYVPTEKAVREGGYGASECSFLAADAGEKMIREGAACIDELVRSAAHPPFQKNR